MSTINLFTRKKTGITVLKVNGKRLCFLSITQALEAANRIKETYKCNADTSNDNSKHHFARRALSRKGASYANV